MHIKAVRHLMRPVSAEATEGNVVMFIPLQYMGSCLLHRLLHYPPHTECCSDVILHHNLCCHRELGENGREWGREGERKWGREGGREGKSEGGVRKRDGGNERWEKWRGRRRGGKWEIRKWRKCGTEWRSIFLSKCYHCAPEQSRMFCSLRETSFPVARACIPSRAPVTENA